jgi:hypothetical protein
LTNAAGIEYNSFNNHIEGGHGYDNALLRLHGCQVLRDDAQACPHEPYLRALANVTPHIEFKSGAIIPMRAVHFKSDCHLFFAE